MGKKVPIRTCIGCQTKKSKAELVRFVLDAAGDTSLDSTGRAAGRGVYLCCEAGGKVRSACLEGATKRNAFSRAFKKGVKRGSVAELVEGR